MKKLLTYLILISLFAVVFSCSRVKESNFYVLEYKPQVPKEIKVKKKFPYNVQVNEFSINRAYDNSRIVIRKSAHKIFYDRYSLWALRPQQSLSDLLIKHINSYNIFLSCKKRFLHIKPDYMIQGSIKRIEKYDNPEITRADLQFTLELSNLKTDKVVLKREYTAYRELYTDNMSFFARALSDQVKNSYEEFIMDVIQYLEKKEK